MYLWHHIIIFSHVKGCSADRRCIMGETQKHAKWKQWDTKGYILWFLLYEMYRCVNPEIENRLWLPGAESREEQEVTASWVCGSFKVEMGIAQDCECHWIVKPRWLIFIMWISLRKKKHSKGVYFRLRWRICQESMGHSLLLSGDCDLRVGGGKSSRSFPSSSPSSRRVGPPSPFSHDASIC